ncbi:MAG: SAM-dependent methyltransferase [Bdellovibrio sp. ArHS]|uniref:class I SAM-dependent methyltransferase n=1 Tax=Bdellovibrio sp. ArHS TaxID=1569284 RepID=UPI0005828669|nr:class I SAM-dependent methyltransferase [Bdellovibrio sp. ArHS]KHD88875.1 MAG: SAM-dependent methyltransferase [Bdellovibrio sp. ArHS]
MSQFFSKESSQAYDEKNSKLAPISGAMHFLIQLVLQDLPKQARILCVGVGTGAEILSLSKVYPEWTFVGVDPAEGMLAVCRERLEQAGVLNRCELIHGYVQDVPHGENFDAVLSVLVGHFVKRDERLGFYQNMTARLREGGYLINTEISFDLNSAQFPLMLKNWEQVQALMGATPESLATLPKQLKDMLTVLSTPETEDLLRQSGIAIPVRFFQAFMISGWYGKKWCE